MKEITPPCIRITSDAGIPAIGLGTNSTLSEKHGDIERAIKCAIDTGYRYIDTSRLYWNQEEIGLALEQKITENIIQRSDIFVTNKIWCTNSEAMKIQASCRESLAKLRLDYVDLCLMHIPSNFAFKGDAIAFPIFIKPTHKLCDVEYVKTWSCMERLVELGLARNIGLSNATAVQLERILATATIKPVSNHIECSPGLDQKKIIELCHANGILVTTYCPLNESNFQRFSTILNNDYNVKEICQKYTKTSSQLILKYLYQLGTVPIPKTIVDAQLQEYYNIFDFVLNHEEMAIIDGFYTDERFFILEQELAPKPFPIYVKKIFIGNRED